MNNNDSNILIKSELLNEDEEQKYIFTSDRQLVDFVEIGTLSFLIVFGTLLNFLSFARLIRFSRWDFKRAIEEGFGKNKISDYFPEQGYPRISN